MDLKTHLLMLAQAKWPSKTVDRIVWDPAYRMARRRIQATVMDTVWAETWCESVYFVRRDITFEAYDTTRLHCKA